MGMGKSTWDAVDKAVEDAREDEAWDLNDRVDRLVHRASRHQAGPEIDEIQDGGQR